MCANMHRDVLWSDVQRMSHRATASQRTSIEDRCQKLEARLNTFSQKAEEIMGKSGDEETVILPQFTGFQKESQEEPEEESGSENEGSNSLLLEDPDDDDDYEEDNNLQAPENTALCMPSSLTPEDIERLGLQSLADQELKLQEGQANDCLMGLWMALGHKAVLFCTKMRNSSTSVGKTRAWDDVKAVNVKVNKHARGYRCAHNALERLGADDATMRRYEK